MIAKRDPSDITPLGQDFDMAAQIEKFKNFKFPKSGDARDRRSFQLQWFSKYDWLEYSVSLDAAFCYHCRQFGETSKDPTFTLNGYKAWKTALTDKKGFSKQSTSIGHMNASARYAEKKKRIQSGTSVSELLNTTVLEKRRYYCRTIVEVVMFLASNRLALRGEWDEEEKEEGGLFNSLFELLLKRDSQLIESQKHMPKNATYTSPLIQNEFISIVAHLLRSSIVDEVKNADADCFTILFDGTKDKNGKECVSIAVRFISKGKPIEALLFFESTEDVDAQSFTQLLLSSLESYGLNAKKIISQCYDGAPVMNGYKSGVAKRLEVCLEKSIPYIHCFNHRLRLVIIETVKVVDSIKEFFEVIQMIYTAFKKPKIAKLYEGTAVQRLIDTRWTGHFTATKAVRKNYQELVKTLKKIKNDKKNTMKLDGDDIALCIGIHAVVTTNKFVFNLVYMDEFLAALAPADTVFQSHDIGYNRAIKVLDAVKSTIAAYRTDYFPDKCDEMLAIAHHLIGPQATGTDAPCPTRDRRRSTLLREFVVEESIGERSDEFDEIRSCFHEVIDVTLAEFKNRFTENNEVLSALSKSSNMELDELKPLEKLGVALPSVHEIQTAKNYIENKKRNYLRMLERTKNDLISYPRYTTFEKRFQMSINYMH